MMESFVFSDRAYRWVVIVSLAGVKQTFSLSVDDDCVVYATHDVTLREAAVAETVAR